ncbi:hypothetical protein TL16_g04316 [Triparma laevis f. inornata]|uniref:Uncharacterized protein n=1 Tax=Triparma laevis f. inornata TaxID=1714386 RepID=A0A9W7AAL7_9STRA|nr:hypothetical protein TL16_g04316 [Triparma laevis f. inornata]
MKSTALSKDDGSSADKDLADDNDCENPYTGGRERRRADQARPLHHQAFSRGRIFASVHEHLVAVAHSAATHLQRIARGDSGRKLAKEIIDTKRKEEKRKKRAIEHSHKYDPRSHWSPPAGHVCHPDNKITKAAIHVQKLVRGDSARKLAEKEKKKKEKTKRRKSGAGYANILRLGLNKQQKLELAYQEGYLETNMDKASKKNAADLERSERKRERMRSEHGGRSTKKTSHFGEENDSDDDRSIAGSDAGSEHSSRYSMDLESGMTHAQYKKIKQIETEFKKHHIEIYDDDDEETRAYKIKLNYLSDEKKRGEMGIKEGDLGSLSHKKGEREAIAEPRTNPANDCAILCCLLVFIGAYYGFCVYLVIQGGALIIVAAVLGIGVPGGLIWLTAGWKKAKKENKRAIFLW